jgi:hypothetical protein
MCCIQRPNFLRRLTKIRRSAFPKVRKPALHLLWRSFVARFSSILQDVFTLSLIVALYFPLFALSFSRKAVTQHHHRTLTTEARNSRRRSTAEKPREERESGGNGKPRRPRTTSQYTAHMISGYADGWRYPAVNVSLYDRRHPQEGPAAAETRPCGASAKAKHGMVAGATRRRAVEAW